MPTIADLKLETEVPVVLAEHEGFITYVNTRFTAVFGWSSAEIQGRPLTMIIPKALHDAHHLGFSRFLASGTPTLLNRPLQLKAVRKDGTEFVAEHFIIAEEQNGRWVFGATIKPI